MNLAGVLSLGPWIFNLLLTSFLLVSASAQIVQKKEITEQTSFSMEFPFDRPVALGEAAKKALASDRSIADVMKDDQLSVDTIPKDWFTASEVHLGPKSETDLVVMGLGISLGPYSAGFWVLRQTPQGFEIVMATDTHDLTLLDTSTNGLRDIETGLPTGGQRYSDTYRFDGRAYQKNLPKPASSDSEEQRIFKPKAIADGVVRNDVWFHRGTWIGPNNKEVGVVTSKFRSSDEAANWVSETLLKAAKISTRMPMAEFKGGPAIGERIVAILPAEKEGGPLTILVWTEGPTVREIYSVSPDIVFLAEKVFLPHCYALIRAEK
jgi:hypothetical protein